MGKGRPVVHFEVHGRNAAALQDFYSKAFGWDIHADNPMNYGMVHTNADGKGIEPGLARSPTTRRAGFVSLPDVAPTVLDAYGIDLPNSMAGTAMNSPMTMRKPR